MPSKWASGWREIGPQRKYFRSRWEANYARYLELVRQQGKIIAWEHEPKTFWFEGVRRGVVSYKPDFRVTLPDGSHVWHEVKGRMDHRSQMCIKRMAKHFPGEKLVVIDGAMMGRIDRKYSAQCMGWERDDETTVTEPFVGRRIR